MERITKEQRCQLDMIFYIDECHEILVSGEELTDRQIKKLETILDKLDEVILGDELGECYAYWCDLCEDTLCSI